MNALQLATTTAPAASYEVAADFHAATTAAYRIGALSAQLGEMCCPEMTFLFLHDRREFCKGFASVAGHTLTTVQFLGVQ